jgi:transposase
MSTPVAAGVDQWAVPMGVHGMHSHGARKRLMVEAQHMGTLSSLVLSRHAVHALAFLFLGRRENPDVTSFDLVRANFACDQSGSTPRLRGTRAQCAKIDGTYICRQTPTLQEVQEMRVAEAIELDAKTERALRTLSKGRRVEARVLQRASVILLAAQGWQNKDIADAVKLDRRQVALWRRRFIEGGLEALLQDAARSGRTPSVTRAVESLILSRTLHEQPAEATHWSTRTLAAHLGLSATTIRRVWQRNGIKPHLQDG